MRTTQLLIALFLLVARAGVALAAPPAGAQPCQPKNEAFWHCVLHDVSMLRLLADPAAFDGKRVRTVAFLASGEGESLAYLHREDQQAQLQRHALLLQGLPASACRSGHYVTLEGVFHLPDMARWAPAEHDGCLTCRHSSPGEHWLRPVGGSLDVLRCMPRP